MNRVIVSQTDVDPADATHLAARLGLEVADPTGRTALCRAPDGSLELRLPDGGRPLRVDLSARRPRGSLLLRALGAAAGGRRIVDATAGLGQDGWELEQFGCEVTFCERIPWVAALLEDGLRRAGSDALVVTADAASWLPSVAVRPDAVYLDPMFAPRNKSALPRRELQVLRDLCEAANDEAALLEVARRAATSRVVVKRRHNANPIAGQSPANVLRGKLVRFDIYTPLG